MFKGYQWLVLPTAAIKYNNSKTKELLKKVNVDYCLIVELAVYIFNEKLKFKETNPMDRRFDPLDIIHSMCDANNLWDHLELTVSNGIIDELEVQMIDLIYNCYLDIEDFLDSIPLFGRRLVIYKWVKDKAILLSA